MSEKVNISFTLGPVQGFLAQARRTRDLWSGSFLLSYLSGCAMSAVVRDGGWVILPDVSNEPLLSWIGGLKTGDPPRIGTIPNRFEAVAENPKKAALSASTAVKVAWNRIADAVWNGFLEGIAADHGCGTKSIWERQIAGFWEISWSVGPVGMASRKNWRSHTPPVEGGDHCTMMGDWQELSGFLRSKDNKKQKEFWYRLRSQHKVGNLDLREDERLCAIALIKRLFPKVSTEAIGWQVDGNNWPSTLYVAAVPWLEKVAAGSPELAENYARAVSSSAKEARRSGISKQIGSLRSLGSQPFLDLDGNYYFIGTLEDCRRTPLSNMPKTIENCESKPGHARDIRRGLEIQLKDLYKAWGAPSPFYGLLIMDGDKMGELIKADGIEVSRALKAFTRDVIPTVRDHNGVTIYAGGDDVLAMLPLPYTLGCASDLSQKFEGAFKARKMKATISSGLVFSHYHVPLRTVLREAHYILDEIAKDDNGRGSIAVSVLKNSGKYCQWVTTWEGLKGRMETRIDDLVSATVEANQKQFSTSFFYKTRDLLNLLSENPVWRPGSYWKLTENLEGLNPLDLMMAEYMRSQIGSFSKEEAKGWVEELLGVCYRNKRDKEGVSRSDEKCLSADAALLVKFLSMGGDGE